MEESKEQEKKEENSEIGGAIEDITNPHRKKLWYSEMYKKRYEEKYKKKEEKPLEIKKEIIDEIKEINKIEEKIIEYAKEPKHVRILKIAAILIPAIIVLYLVYANFLASKDFIYFYDIGSETDKAKPYLTPLNRVSESYDSGRNMTGGLVYFNVPVPRGSEKIEIEARFKDNFPENSQISLGAQDRGEWHYAYKTLYNKALSNLSELYRQGNIYLLNENLSLVNEDSLKNMENIVIATDRPFSPSANKIENYSGNVHINASLRGGHVFYVYASGKLSIDIKKQDINWYNGTDELNVYLYDLNENLMANSTIPDDGISGIESKKASKIQEGKLEAENLPESVYKLVFTDFDGLIREIRINTGKIVAEKLFLADSSAYLLENRKTSVYTETGKSSKINLLTYHSQGIQNISYNNKIFNFSQEDSPLSLELENGSYVFGFPKNDIIISYPGYFAFSKESYFEPFRQKIVSVQNDFQWLKENADYLITGYENPEKENEWIISKAEFGIKNESLFVKDNKLSLLFNIPHLSQEQNLNYTIPIDWISIKVHKPGLIEKWREK